MAIDARRGHLILHVNADRLFESWDRRVDRGHIAAARDVAKPFLHQRLRGCGVHITGQNQHGVIRAVIILEPLLEVIKLGGRKVLKAADGIVVIGVADREQRL